MSCLTFLGPIIQHVSCLQPKSSHTTHVMPHMSLFCHTIHAMHCMPCPINQFMFCLTAYVLSYNTMSSLTSLVLSTICHTVFILSCNICTALHPCPIIQSVSCPITHAPSYVLSYKTCPVCVLP